MLHSLILSLATFRFSISAPIEKGSYYVPAPAGGRPNCARDKLTFCESIEKYPTELIQKLLRYEKSDLLSSIFTDERDGLEEPPEHILHQEFAATSKIPHLRRTKRAIHSRKNGVISNDLFKPALSHNTRCTGLRRFTLPKAAETVQGHWRYIIGRKEHPQLIEIETCSDSCLNKCVQKFSQVRLLCLEPEGTMKEDVFLLPSSCICEENSDREELQYNWFHHN